MLKKFGVILLAVLFIGAMTYAPIIGTVDAAAKCDCGKDCNCGKDCKCGKDCNCGKDCKCGKDCNCGKDHKCGKDCKCSKGCKCKNCAANAKVKPVKPTSEAAYANTMVSKAGTFKVTYTSDLQPVPVNKLQSWKLKVETADGKPVKNAKITVNGTMPEHGHGMPTQPKVTKNYGDGAYLVEGMKFSMPGWWVVNVSVKSGGKTDKASFNLMLK